MTKLAPLGYPVYLMQMAVERYYWLATRGMERQHWWGREGEIPFPVAWYEFFLILFITVVVGGLINTFIVPPLMPHSIALGVRVCSWLSRVASKAASYCLGESTMNGISGPHQTEENQEKAREQLTAYEQVEAMVRGLTGVQVSPESALRNLGLDSLGAAALLGTLRSSVPAARKLTLLQLHNCDTVGDLAELLQRESSTESQQHSRAAPQ